MLSQVNRRVVSTAFSALVIALGTLVAIHYAKGGFRLTRQGFIQGSGLLSANSSPTGAQVLINGKLITATDDTIYLEPGLYDVQLKKDGYSDWRKQLSIEKELVTQTNAALFPSAPSLTPLTFTGVQNVTVSPDGQKIMFYTASASAETKNGLYVLELSNNPLSLQRGSRQVTSDDDSFKLKSAQVIWAPDSNSALLAYNDRYVMLDLNTKVELAAAKDVSFQKKQLLSEWEEEIYLREREYLSLFPDEVIAVATQSAKNLYFSPDKKKIMYTATASATLPLDLIPPVPATNTQPEQRLLKPGTIYVYDREEDKNFYLGMEVNAKANNDKYLLATDLYSSQALTLSASPGAFQRLQASSSAQTAAQFNTYYSSLFASTLQWLADSRHLLYIANDTIRVVEYDGTNDTTLYAGPFADHFVYPWPDGSKALILTSFSPQSPMNLYGIELK